ncbi:MAG: redoxin domain-containing protein [Pseudomonadota bacterium]
MKSRVYISLATIALLVFSNIVVAAWAAPAVSRLAATVGRHAASISLLLGLALLTVVVPMLMGVRWLKKGMPGGSYLLAPLAVVNILLLVLSFATTKLSPLQLLRERGGFLPTQVSLLWRGSHGSSDGAPPDKAASSSQSSNPASSSPPSTVAPSTNGPYSYPEPVLPVMAKQAPGTGWKAPDPDDFIPKDQAQDGLTRFLLDSQKSIIGRPDFRERFDRLEMEAQDGKAGAQLQLGAYLCDGKIVKRDVAAGLRWLNRAAEQGSADAMYELGRLFKRGKIVPDDDRNAVAWFYRAALLGHPKAEHELGWHIINGAGVDRDVTLGMEWYRRAAEHGDDQSMLALAGEYEHANRVPRDMAMARQWYEAAKAKGNRNAAEKLARLDGKAPEGGAAPPQTRERGPDSPDIDPWKLLGEVYAGAGKHLQQEKERKRRDSFRNEELIGKSAPSLEANNGLGEKVSLQQLAGKSAVWLGFVAPACSRSRTYSERISALQQGYQGRAVFLTVLSGENGEYAEPRDAAKWAASYGLDPRFVLADPRDSYTTGLGIGPSPHQVGVDKNGIVRGMQSGIVSSDIIRQSVDSLLQANH